MTTARGTAADAWSTVLAPAAELDLSVAPQLHALLQAAARPGATVALDVRDVTFVDSSALAVVLGVHRTLRRSGGGLVLVHAQTPVLRVLRLCGLTGLLGPLTPSTDVTPSTGAPCGASAHGTVDGHVCRHRRVRRRRRRA